MRWGRDEPVPVGRRPAQEWPVVDEACLLMSYDMGYNLMFVSEEL